MLPAEFTWPPGIVRAMRMTPRHRAAVGALVLATSKLLEPAQASSCTARTSGSSGFTSGGEETTLTTTAGAPVDSARERPSATASRRAPSYRPR